MKKITPEKAIELSRKLNRFTYFSNPFVLSNCLLETKNEEEIIIDQETGLKNPVFLPERPENIKLYNYLSAAYEEDVKKLEELGFKITKKELYGLEYIYRIEEFIKLEGSKFKEMRKEVNRFKKNYKFKILHEYPKKKIIEFMEDWKNRKNLASKPKNVQNIFNMDYQESIDYINIMDKIPHKELFVEVNGKLAGFCIFLRLENGLWVGLMQKTDIKYSGISRFMQNLKAYEMKEGFFTTGTEAQDTGLKSFKESLNPVMKIPVYEVGYE